MIPYINNENEEYFNRLESYLERDFSLDKEDLYVDKEANDYWLDSLNEDYFMSGLIGEQYENEMWM